MTAPTARRGFTEEALQDLMARREEPEWLRERRLAAWRAYEAMPMPGRTDEEWRRTDLSRLRLGEVRPFPQEGTTGESLVPATERKESYAGFVGISNGQPVEQRLSDALKAQGVIFTDMTTAAREHGELVRRYFMTEVVPATDSKFAALHGAFWETGVFLYLPKGIVIDQPLRAIVSAALEGASSLSHTLIVLEENSQAIYAEDFVSDETKPQGFSTRVVEIVLKQQANLRYVGSQRWGRN